jgi:hypothetical protein
MTVRPPTLRAFFAILAVLLNTLLPAGWAVAEPAAATHGNIVYCLATGGTMTAPLPGTGSPVEQGDLGEHCKICPLPLATALPSIEAPAGAQDAPQNDPAFRATDNRLLQKSGYSPQAARGPPV